VNIDNVAQIPKIVDKTHFAILVLPKKYGLNEVREQLIAKNTVFLEPKVHDRQKTAIINVDDIAELERITRTKQSKSLTIVLLATETMGDQAQNKFLKLLEEPGDNIHFVFVTEDSSNLLSTVRSRGQIYHIKKINKAASQNLAKSLSPNLDTKTLQQMMFLANGLPGEIKKLATDKRYLASQAELVDAAKTILGGSDFAVIKLVNQLKDNRAKAAQIVDTSITIAKETLKKNPSFIAKLDALERIQAQLSASGNVRLCLVANLLDV
jgi:DNA polymerase-3 subunit delta'